jgi:hypothetical protein
MMKKSMEKKMVDLKMTKAEKKKQYEVSESSTNNYPWETSIRFDAKMVNKLGLEGLKAGDEVYVMAMGKVTQVQVKDSDNSEKPTSLSIQLQRMAVSSTEDYEADMRKEEAKKVFKKDA